MKAKSKKGFTLVEVLFVMVILAILAGMATVYMKSSSTSATISSMKSDARNAISAAQSYYAENQEYPENLYCSYAATDGTGLCSNIDPKLTVSKNNVIKIKEETCDDGGDGFTITVTNTKISDKEIAYDSCTDGVIQLVNSSN